MINEAKEREEFEAHCHSIDLCTMRTKHWYDSTTVQNMWQGYLTRARKAAEDAEKWLPIESAPRHAIADNVWLLGINMNGSGPHRPFLMRNTFEPNEQFTHAAPGACWQEPGKEWPCYPTHWRPLPPPPAAQEGGGA